VKILVTGSEGFIGKHLVNLLKEKHEIFEFDRNKNRNLNIIGDLAEVFMEFKPDVVVHLASNISNDIDDCKNDIIALLNLLVFCRNFQVKKFIFTSSAAVYGNSYPNTVPINPYGIAKLQCEDWCNYYSELGLPIIILRLANVYGLNGKGIINQFTNRIKNNLSLIINNDGFQTRDYIHVTDVVNVIEQIIISDITNDTLNVSRNISTNIWELLGFFYTITQKNLTICFGPEIKNEIIISKLNNSDLIMSEFLHTEKFRNFISLQKGIEDLWKKK